MRKDFYVYYYLNEQGLPYYVGKGTGRRAYAKHLYVSVPPKERIRFLIRNTTENWALYKEGSFIARWGLLRDGTGTLENQLDKPHPTNNKPHSEETKRKISEGNKKNWKENPRDAWNKGVSGYSTSLKGTTLTQEAKEHLSRVMKGRSVRGSGWKQPEELNEHQRNNHPRNRAVVVSGTTYRSVSEAARQLGVSRTTIRNRLRAA